MALCPAGHTVEAHELSPWSYEPLPSLMSRERGEPLWTHSFRETSQFRYFQAKILLCKNVIGKLLGSGPQGIKK